MFSPNWNKGCVRLEPGLGLSWDQLTTFGHVPAEVLESQLSGFSDACRNSPRWLKHGGGLLLGRCAKSEYI